MTMNVQEETVEERTVFNRSESAGELALRKVEQYQNSSKLVQPARRGSVNKLCWDDIELGRLLDCGSFSRVYEATLRQDACMDPAPFYAVKCLRENISDGTEEDTLVTYAVDLALEANILAKLMHPNIIRLYGSMSGSISDAFHDTDQGFFLVLDLLSDTLDKRLTRWRRAKRAAGFSFRPNQSKRQMHERIEDVALGVADGLEYVHSRNIIYRDLKPHNIGFDEAGTVKLFDFGLAREADSLGNLRQMTGNAGTPRYMSPEVARQDSYGYPSDVYSFSILLWEIITLDRPFDSVKSIAQFNEDVVRRHHRPPLKKVHSPELESLLEQCWDKDQENRPDFSEVCQVLRKHLSDTEPKSSRLKRYRSALISQRSSGSEDNKTPNFASTPGTQDSEHQQQKRNDSDTNTETTAKRGSSLSTSRATTASDESSEGRSARSLSFLSWRRKTFGSVEEPIANRSYRERNWIQRKLLRHPTMCLDLSSKSYTNRRFDLGNPGSFRSSGSVHSGEEGGGRRPSMNSKASAGSVDHRPQRRRSSGKMSESTHIEAMAAALAAETKSNRQYLREIKRGDKSKRN